MVQCLWSFNHDQWKWSLNHFELFMTFSRAIFYLNWMFFSLFYVQPSSSFQQWRTRWLKKTRPSIHCAQPLCLTQYIIPGWRHNWLPQEEENTSKRKTSKINSNIFILNRVGEKMSHGEGENRASVLQDRKLTVLAFVFP